MPDCRQCGKRWPDGYSMCPDDGQSLGGIAMGSTIATSPGGSMAAIAPDIREDLAPGSFAGEYQIERKIGQGGMGSVYGARHPLIGKRAAIKVISRELSVSAEGVDRFVLEAQAVNQIAHENIVDVFGFGKLPDGRSFFVMEWLQGESLRKRLERPISYLDSLEILDTIAKALQAAHEAGVLHRDLKPDNVYLEAVKGESPNVKLLDFGLAKLTGSGHGTMERTRTGVVMGTPLYLSPEQAKGTKVDSATDVYSLGIIAFEMLTGRVPFMAESAVEIMAQHISEPAPSLAQVAPHVPVELDRLITGMLMKHPRARPSAGVVREKILAARELPGARMIGPPPATVPAASPWTPPPTRTPVTPSPVTAPVASPIVPPAAAQTGLDVQPDRSSRLGVFIGIGVAIAIAVVGVVVMKTSDKPASTAPKTEVATAKPAEPVVVAPVPVPVTPVELPKVEPAKPMVPETVVVPTAAKIEPARPVAKSGKLSVTIVGPAFSQLIIDGKPAGKHTGGARIIELSAGDHTVVARATGYKPAQITAHVAPGVTREIKLSLEARRTLNDAPDPFEEQDP